jgi:hypothetical protein
LLLLPLLLLLLVIFLLCCWVKACNRWRLGAFGYLLDACVQVIP